MSGFAGTPTLNLEMLTGSVRQPKQRTRVAHLAARAGETLARLTSTSRRPPALALGGPTTPSFSIRSTSFAALL